MMRSSPSFLEHALVAVEAQLQELSAALLAPDPFALQTCSEQMRQVAIDFVAALGGLQGQVLSEPLQRRIQQIHATLSIHRDSLARLAAVADRLAEVLLPPADSAPTYAPGLGFSAGVPVAARIYSAAG